MTTENLTKVYKFDNVQFDFELEHLEHIWSQLCTIRHSVGGLRRLVELEFGTDHKHQAIMSILEIAEYFIDDSADSLEHATGNLKKCVVAS